MITSALLGLALAAPAEDSPIEPIDSAIVLLLENTDEGAELCGQIAEYSLAIDQLGLILGDDSIGVMLEDAGHAYFEQSFVDGFGPEYALTPEAKVAFRDWMTGCAL